MSSTTHCALALPLMAMGVGSAYLNHGIQKAWVRGYEKPRLVNKGYQ